MSDAWSSEALIARFDLHPEFKEVYVEGESDMGFYQWFLKEQGIDDVIVYPISAIELTEDIRRSHVFPNMDEDSNRTDVIVFGLLLQEGVPTAVNRITCIADADTQYIFPISLDSDFLVFTDYTSIEMYAFRPKVITKLIQIGAPRLRLRGEEVLDKLTGVLEALFSLRVANHRLAWGLSWIRFDKDLAFSDGELSFNETAFANKYLNTKGERKKNEEFWNEVTLVRNSFGADHRLQIRGHDFIELLLFYLRKKAYRAFQKFSDETLQQNLLAQLQLSDLAHEHLFSLLVSKYRDNGSDPTRG